MTPMAADDPLLLRAFRSLDPADQAVLCPQLAVTSEDVAPASEPGTRGRGSISARRQLSDAYLRFYAAEAPSRTCRHLAAVLDDAVRGGVSHRSPELDLHADACSSCALVRAELTAVHGATASALVEVLLSSASAAAATVRAESGDEDHPVPREQTPCAAAPAGPSFTPGVASRLRALVTASPSRAAAVAGATVTALGAAVVAFSGASGDTGSPLARTTVAAPGSALPTAEPSAVASASPSRTAGAASGPPATPHAPTAPAKTTAPVAAAAASVTSPGHTPPRPPAGFQLVNRSTGLCVAVQSPADGAMLRLDVCDAGAARQRWETVAAGYGAHQLRNVGTHKCLDGTDGGGNVVRVVQSDCHNSYSAQRTIQLWITKPQSDEGAFRLHFAPTVHGSDYSSHLLGPEDWWRENPPRQGSYLARLPNYYNSESFVFTTAP